MNSVTKRRLTAPCGEVVMKAFKRPTQIGFVALIMMSLVFTDIKAQPVTGFLKESMASAQDTMLTSKEAKSIELLDISLRSLSDKARHNRYIGGYAMIGTGIGLGIAGAATLAFGFPYLDDDDARIVGYSFLGAGVLVSGLSLLPFKISSESERIYAEFSKMPADKPDQVHQKFYYGDRRFEELAQGKRRERLIVGSTSIIVGVASLLLIDESKKARYATFTGSVITGVVILLSKYEEEKRYETYRRAKEDIIGDTGGLEIHFGIAVLPEGGMLGAVQVRF